MFQQQFVDAFGRLVGREMADAGQHFEAIGRRDEIPGAFGGDAPDGVVGVAPDVERRDPDHAERPADRAARAIPGERCFHRVLVAEHGEMLLDRGSGNAIGGQALAQPSGVVGQHHIGGIGLQKRLVMPRALRLLAVGHLQRAIERVRMRPRQNGERGQPLVIAVGEAPGDAAAPVVADEMKARLAIAGRPPRSPSRRPSGGRSDSAKTRADPAGRPANSRAGSAQWRDSPCRRAPRPARASNASIPQSRAAAAPAARRARRR